MKISRAIFKPRSKLVSCMKTALSTLTLDLNVQAHGDVCAGAFGGSKLVLQSRKGNIFVNKYQGDLFSVTTQNGDIVLKGAVVATDIKVVADIGVLISV